MRRLMKPLLTSACFLLAAPAFAAGPSSKPPSPKPSTRGAPQPDAERYAHRCQNHAPDRDYYPQGTMLWGTKRSWNEAQENSTQNSVLVSVDTHSVRLGSAPAKNLKLENGHLVASPGASTNLVGTVLKGASSDGTPVEVAICGAEPAPGEPSMMWYRIETWNPVAQTWDNPCVATSSVPDPRALAMPGVWDGSGARQDVAGKFTLACENGAIAKCANWGYKPWKQRKGQSLAELHQACTRMARADYCGNGQSHTRQGNIIDMYDTLGVSTPTTQASPSFDPARASFEAAWTADGAACMARTRDGRAMETILQECPGRFHTDKAVDLGQGDSCTVLRADVSPEAATLRNRSYGPQQGAAMQGSSK